MEVVSRSFSNSVMSALVVAALLALLAGPATAADLDVTGTWHVLVHYKDQNANHPERERWDDRVWVFEKAGSRLRWTEYPIVVFNDQRGRFDQSLGRSARVLEFWEPDPTQVKDIKDGLSVNERGMKSKSLRGSDSGWASFSRNTTASASVIGYTEHWSIDNEAPGPVFKRRDVLGAFEAEDMDGVTLYTTEAIEDGGSILRGKFERDGTRHGTFRMMRSAQTEGLKSDGRTPNEKVSDRAREALEALGYGDGDGGE
jgi:hypothetical protein